MADIERVFSSRRRVEQAPDQPRADAEPAIVVQQRHLRAIVGSVAPRVTSISLCRARRE